MDPIGVAAAASTLVVASLFALVRRSRDGRFRGDPSLNQPSPGSLHSDGRSTSDSTAADRLRRLAGGRPTFVQFSGEVCTQCRRNEREFSRVLATRPEFGFLDLAVEENLDLVRELRIMRSPTVLFVQPSAW